MNGYIMTLLGVILLSVLIDIILPNGSTSKYISGMFAIFVIFVIITPVVNWVKNDYKLTDYMTSSEIELNDKLLKNMYISQINALEEDLSTELANNGYEGVVIDIQFKVVAESVEIERILVDITKLVINNPSTNINRYVYIRQVIMEHISVTEEVIEFCE